MVQNEEQAKVFYRSGDPTSIIAAEGRDVPAFSGRSGDHLTSDVHGKWYNAGYYGATFIAAPAAGVIGAYGTITNLTGMILWNPLGSGKNVELISLALGNSGSATMVISDIRWAVYTGVG